MPRHITDHELDDMATTPGHPFHGIAAAVLWHEALGDASAPEIRSLIRAVCRAVLDARPDLAGRVDPLLEGIETRPPPLPGLGQIPAATAHLPRIPPGTWPTHEDAFVHGWAQGVRDVRSAIDTHDALHNPIERAVRWLKERATP